MAPLQRWARRRRLGPVTRHRMVHPLGAALAPFSSTGHRAARILPGSCRSCVTRLRSCGRANSPSPYQLRCRYVDDRNGCLRRVPRTECRATDNVAHCGEPACRSVVGYIRAAVVRRRSFLGAPFGTLPQSLVACPDWASDISTRSARATRPAESGLVPDVLTSAGATRAIPTSTQTCCMWPLLGVPDTGDSGA